MGGALCADHPALSFAGSLSPAALNRSITSRPFPGGRATSYRLPDSEVIDNCQHILLRCCVNLLDFYKRLGVERDIAFSREFTFIEPGGRRSLLRSGVLPPPIDRTLYSLVDDKMTKYLERETGRPFWINSSARDGKVEIQVEVEKGLIFRIRTDEDRAYAANTGMLLLGMLLSSLVLLIIAVIFLRKQIAPIVELANAAKSFGMGREVTEFRPRGAREVRQAGLAFVDMKSRIARHVEQRTAMLAGVSHDLRTILTRFKLELAFLGDGPKIKPLKEDVEEMQRMLEAYMAFVRGDGGERSEDVNLAQMFSSVAAAVARGKSHVTLDVQDVDVSIKPNAFRRLISNLLGNAVRYSNHVKVKGGVENRLLTILVDDDGPGIPAENREDAFRPFVRLDNARNLDETGTGLGLAIALDIAHAHGGDIKLDESPAGGLRAMVQIPV